MSQRDTEIPTVNEDTSSRLVINLWDNENIPAPPLSAKYRVDCLTTGRQVRDWVDIDEPTAILTLGLTPEDNCIFNGANQKERRAVQVVAVYDDDDEFHGQFKYDVLNLREAGVTPVVFRGDDGTIIETGGGGWPELTTATVRLYLRFRGQTTIWVGSAPVATGFSKVVRFPYTGAMSGALVAGIYEYSITATVSGVTTTLKTGKVQVK